MQTRSGIPLDEIAPDAPDLRAAVAAVLDYPRVLHTPDGSVYAVSGKAFTALRAAYNATPEPAPAITDEEQMALLRINGFLIGIHDLCRQRKVLQNVLWISDADLAVLARLAGRT